MHNLSGTPYTQGDVHVYQIYTCTCTCTFKLCAHAIHMYMYMYMYKHVYNYAQYTCTTHIMYKYTHVHEKNTVKVGPDKPAIPGQRCFELVSSHQQGIHIHVTCLAHHPALDTQGEPECCGSEASELISLFNTTNTCLTEGNKTRLDHLHMYMSMHDRAKDTTHKSNTR